MNGEAVLFKKNKKAEMKAYEEHEKSKPFARSIEDTEMNEMLQEQERWGDPMAYLAKKTAMKKKKEEKRMWKGFAPPNRFNIIPGHCWDGVDRSNGYELKFLERESVKVDNAERNYLASVEDM